MSPFEETNAQSQCWWLEDLLEGPQVPWQRALSDLMEGSSAHRACAWEDVVAQAIAVALTERDAIVSPDSSEPGFSSLPVTPMILGGRTRQSIRSKQTICYS